MARQTLAVKYRPQTFEDVCSQEAIKTILTEQIRTKTFQHAYLFCGPAGCGKTTSARIFANMINKGAGHPIEVDAASNSSVENIRVIIEDAKKKSLDSEYKVYILDEVHMLSTSAFNALLKLLEEPPKFTIFILATTDPQKIIPTILSRVQRYDFTKIPYDVIMDRLKYICDTENEEQEYCGNGGLIQYTDDALSFIAKLSGGGMRDAITRLDKCISLSNEVSVENVVKALGTVDYDCFFDLMYYLDAKDMSSSVSVINDVYNSGKDLKTFVKEFIKFCVDVCKYKIFNDFTYIDIPKLPKYEEQLNELNMENSFWTLDLFRQINSIIKFDTDVKYTIESIILSELK